MDGGSLEQEPWEELEKYFADCSPFSYVPDSVNCNELRITCNIVDSELAPVILVAWPGSQK